VQLVINGISPVVYSDTYQASVRVRLALSDRDTNINDLAYISILDFSHCEPARNLKPDVCLSPEVLGVPDRV
jgi:hypothetical protein